MKLWFHEVGVVWYQIPRGKRQGYGTSRHRWEKNRLGLLCRSMCERAGLSARHTNHSVRRAAVSNLLERGVHETKVQQLSGHKNVQSLNTYRINSFNQKQIMSSTLSKTLTSSKHLDTFPTINHSSYQALTYNAPHTITSPPAIDPQPTLAIEATTAQNFVATSTQSMDLLNIINDDVLMDFANYPFMDHSTSPTNSIPRFPVIQNCTFNGAVVIQIVNGSK